MPKKIAKVAVARAVYAIDKPYDYMVPQELEERLRPGMRVLVPFAAGNRGQTGWYCQSRYWMKEESSWRCGCGSGISAPSMTA